MGKGMGGGGEGDGERKTEGQGAGERTGGPTAGRDPPTHRNSDEKASGEGLGKRHNHDPTADESLSRLAQD